MPRQILVTSITITRVSAKILICSVPRSVCLCLSFEMRSIFKFWVIYFIAVSEYDVQEILAEFCSFCHLIRLFFTTSYDFGALDKVREVVWKGTYFGLDINCSIIDGTSYCHFLQFPFQNFH